MHDKAGRLIRKTREERGLTLKDVTMATGIDGSLLSRWERGEVTKIRVDLLLPLVRFLKMDLTTVATLLEQDSAAQEAMSGAGADAGPAGGRSEVSDEVAVEGASLTEDRRRKRTRRGSTRRPES